MSLKAELYSAIKNLNGEVLSYEEFETICKRNGRKVSNGERRMRELTHCIEPDIETVISKKHHIIGYCWKFKRYEYQMKLGSQF